VYGQQVTKNVRAELMNAGGWSAPPEALPVKVDVALAAPGMPGRHVVQVGVPAGWERLAGLPGVPFLARDPAEVDGVADTLTVSVEPCALRQEECPLLAGERLAAALGGIVIEASRQEPGALLVVAHAAGGGAEVVAVQRQLPLGDHTVAVTWTVATDRFADAHRELLRLAGDVNVMP